jgi:hypothetical protein
VIEYNYFGCTCIIFEKLLGFWIVNLTNLFLVVEVLYNGLVIGQGIAFSIDRYTLLG